MNQRPRRVTVRGIGGALLALLAGSMLLTSSAQGDQRSDRAEQVRYGIETMRLSYTAYVARATDFRVHGCTKEPPNATVGCHKPPPYNAFNWTTDGCSPPTPTFLKNLFDRPCQLHDFGYRNFGKGLTLGRSENMRRWIDDRFEAEMVSLCNNTYTRWWQKANKVTCVEQAGVIWAAVRNFGGDWSKPLGSTPPAPGSNPTPVAGPIPRPGPTGPAAVAETPGGVTHTWTNYANAGGTQGPSIQTGQTVAIACKAQGFRVADGDTWWYRIASSPWNGGYYASADAFYNNGQTSGSLHGTPFVDPNVPDC